VGRKKLKLKVLKVSDSKWNKSLEMFVEEPSKRLLSVCMTVSFQVFKSLNHTPLQSIQTLLFQGTQYVQTFLLTYHAFATPTQLLRVLVEDYSKLVEPDEGRKDSDPAQFKKAARLRICNFFKKWITDSFYDFIGDQQLIEAFFKFTDSIVSVCDPKIAAQLNQKVNEVRRVVMATLDY